MNWEIYSIGDGAFLERILNSVAMLTGSGSLEQVAAIGFLIGAISLGFKSLMDGGRMPQFQYLLIAWIVYMGMFGTTERVTVTDVYKDEVRVVDNVPLGVAASGTLISYTGYKLTELFEQAFGSVNMTDDGFGYALDAMADVRKATITQDAWGKANSPRDGMDIWRSWSNYVKECTMTGVDLDQYTIPDIQSGSRFSGANAIQQLRFDSDSYGTRLYIDPSLADGGYYNCSEAHDRLASVTTDEAIPRLKQNLAKEMGLYDQDFAPEGPAAAAAADTKLQGALQVLNQSGVSSQDYMIASALYPIFEWGMVGNELDYQRTGQAGMLHDAIQQRNAQWAGEQALFQSVVHPIMTFFEGFIFAITPFMAFLVALGPVGIGIAFKYFFIILWIQLWMPTLAIVNLFLHMSAEREFSALRAGGGYDELKMASFYGIAESDMALQNWIATGGMLASSVPALTLMLLYGSAVTATNLSGRLQSGDFIDEKKVAPDSNKVAPVTQVQGAGVYDRIAGQRTAGADNDMPSIKYGESFKDAKQSAFQEQQSEQRAFNQMLSNARTNTSEMSQEASERLTESYSEGATGAVANRLTEGVASRIGQEDMQNAGISMKDVRSVTGAASVGGAVAGNNSVKSAASIAQETGLSNEQAQKILNAYNKEMSSDESYQTEFREALTEDFAKGEGESYRAVLGDQTVDQLQNQASKAYSASESYQDLQAAEEASQYGRDVTIAAAAEQVANDPGLLSSLNDWERGAGQQYRGEIDERAEMYRQRYNMPSDKAEIAASTYTLAKSGTAEGAMFVAGLMNEEKPVPSRDGVNDNQNAGARSANNAEGRSQDRLADAPDTRSDVRGEVSGRTGPVDGRPDDMGEKAESFFNQQNERFDQQTSEAREGQTEDAAETAVDTLGYDPDNNGSSLTDRWDEFASRFGKRSTPGGDLVNGFQDEISNLRRSLSSGMSGNDLYKYGKDPMRHPEYQRVGSEAAQEAYGKAQDWTRENLPELTSGMQDYVAYAMLNDGKGDGNPADFLGVEKAQAQSEMAQRFGEENTQEITELFDTAFHRGSNENQIKDALSGVRGRLENVRAGNEALGGDGDIENVQTDAGREYAQRREEVLGGLASSDDNMLRYQQMRALPESDQAFIQPEIQQAERDILADLPGPAGYDFIQEAIEQGDAIRGNLQSGVGGQSRVGGGDAGSSAPTLPSDPMTGSSLANGPAMPSQSAVDYAAGGNDGGVPPSQRELAADMSTDMQRQQTLDDIDSRLGPSPSPEAQLQAMDELPLQQQELLRQEYADAEAAQRSGRSWS